MCWIMEKIEYRGFTIVSQVDVQGPDYGHMVTVDADRTARDPVTGELTREEWEFNTVQEAKDYLDELADECEAREEREHQYWVRTGHRPGFWF